MNPELPSFLEDHISQIPTLQLLRNIFTVRNILERIQQRDADGRRLGGVVWHSQGSGDIDG